jgi:hypothetical protein
MMQLRVICRMSSHRGRKDKLAANWIVDAGKLVRDVDLRCTPQDLGLPYAPAV